MTEPGSVQPAVSRRWWWAVAAGLAVLVALGYHHALGLQFLADDLVLVTQAQGRRLDLSLLAVDRTWVFYRPLVLLVWALLERMAPGRVLPYHVLGLVLHWLNSCLVVALAWRLEPTGRRVAIGAGLIFALLPLQVEAVAWPSCLYDLFAALFYLLALLLLLRFWRERRARVFVVALVTYQLCLWSKELAFTWPLAALLVAATVRERPRWRTVAASLVPFAGLLAVGLAQRLLAWGDLGGYRAASRDYGGFFWDRLANAVASLLVPINRLLWPDPAIQLWWLVVAGLVLVGLVSLRRRRLFGFALAWVLVTVVPVLNLLPLGTGLESARLLYLPAVGAAIGLAALVDAVAGAIEAAVPRPRRSVAFPALLVALALVYLVALDLNFQPWRVASRVAGDLPGQLHRLVDRFAPGATLETVGLPRVYRGAQVFNLGFDHAFRQRYGSWFDLRQLEAPAEQAAPADGDVFQVTLAEDAARASWHVAELRGMVRPSTDAGATGTVIAAAGTADCTAWAAWTVLGAQSSCVPGQGLLVQPGGADPGLVSPALDVAPDHWLRVAVDLAPVGAGADGGELQVFWHSPQDWFAEDRSQRIRLAAGPDTRRYLLFVPPGGAAGATNQVRVDPIDRATPVRLERVEVRAIAP
jgi:hypothetical protein